MTREDITPFLKKGVRAYLKTRAYAETMRKAVDKIEREVLQESPLPGPENRPGNRRKYSETITEPNEVYLCEDEEALKKYYQKVNLREREAGLKPDDMADDYCPALVAENLQSDIERLVINEMAYIIGEDRGFFNKLLNAGLTQYQQFIDLTVGLVVNLPDFDIGGK